MNAPTEPLSSAGPSPPRARRRGVTDLVTGAAWTLGVVALVAAGGFWLLGWIELLAIAGFLATLIAVSTVFVLGRRTLSAEVDLGSRRAVVGEPAEGTIRVANRSRRRTLPVRAELVIGSDLVAVGVASLRGGAEQEQRFTVPTRRRAVVRVGPAKIVRTDPLSLFRRAHTIALEQNYYVHPRTVGIDAPIPGVIRDFEGESVRDLSDHDVAFHALRDYEFGDDRRHIHWKSTARTGELMVRQFEQTRRSHLMIVLSTHPADYATSVEFETAVSVTGSFGLHALAQDQTLSIATGTQVRTIRAGQRLLDALAGVDRTPEAMELADEAARAVPDMKGVSAVLFVCGSGVESEDLRHARYRLPNDMRVIAVRCVPGERIGRRRVSDVDVLSIGALDELAGVLRGLV